MQMIDGAMQTFALTLDKFLEHAAKWHPRAEVVTGREDGRDRSHRLRGARSAQPARCRRCCASFGVRTGDRVATLAWNTQAHVEVWYAIMGMGAVCHTLNPRLICAQLAAMVSAVRRARAHRQRRSRCRWRARSPRRAPSIERLLVIDGRGGSSTGTPADRRRCALEPLIAQRAGDVTWGDFEETAPCGLCFTSGTTGAPKGVTYTHRSSYLHTLRLLQADVMAITRARQRAHRRADVPRQCLGPAVRRARRGREAGAAGPADRRRAAWPR